MSKNIKVGIFVTLALLVSGVFVFMIGDNRRMWETKVTFHATFGDVSGLKRARPFEWRASTWARSARWAMRSTRRTPRSTSP
jgi:hypothetical protein